MEKLVNGHIQPVTKLLDRGNGRTVISSADDIIDRGLRNAADRAQLIDGNIAFLTQSNNSLLDRFSNRHRYHLYKNDTHRGLINLPLLS